MNDDKKIKRKLLIKPAIYLIITILVFIICMVNVRRIILFSFLIFNNTMIIPLILYITLLLYMFVEGYILIAYFVKDKEKLSKFNDKIDIPRFIDAVILFAMFLVVFIITPCNVSGTSMENTLHDGNKIVCSDLFYTPKQDDIIIFDSTKYAGTKTELFVKRVIATPGQKVEFIDNGLYVDSELVCSNLSTYEYKTLYNSNLDEESSAYEASYIVAKDKYIVMGDNRGASYDSRKFGQIDRKDIYGHVLFRLYPFTPIEKNIK